VYQLIECTSAKGRKDKAGLERHAAAALIGVLARMNDIQPRATGDESKPLFYMREGDAFELLAWQAGLIAELIDSGRLPCKP
jgi:hypothetical protein